MFNFQQKLSFLTISSNYCKFRVKIENSLIFRYIFVHDGLPNVYLKVVF